MIDLINQTVVPELTGISRTTAEILERTKKIEERLGIAASYPGTAKDVLRPYLDSAVDLSNKRYQINQFLDLNGQSTFRLPFSVTGNCQLFHESSQRVNFAVGYQVLSDRGTQIFKTFLGSQPKYPPISLTTGIYQILITVRRGAGQYRLDLATRCD